MMEDGFYWVCLDDDRDWTVAERDGDKWWVIGCEEPWARNEIHEVGPKIDRPRLDAWPLDRWYVSRAS